LDKKTKDYWTKDLFNLLSATGGERIVQRSADRVSLRRYGFTHGPNPIPEITKGKILRKFAAKELRKKCLRIKYI
jgi:hypothetical protein